MRQSPSNWPSQTDLPSSKSSEDQKKNGCLHVQFQPKEPIIPLDRFSSYNILIHVTSWVMRFTRALRNHLSRDSLMKSPLTVKEFVGTEMYWRSVSKSQFFCSELKSLISKQSLPFNSSLCTLHSFLDTEGILRVGGRTGGSKLAYSMMHHIILNGKHLLAKLIIERSMSDCCMQDLP